jgi:hypothetical protein
MTVTHIEYTVSMRESHGGIIVCSGLLRSRGKRVLLAESFCTHLAQRESSFLSGATRVSVGRIDV